MNVSEMIEVIDDHGFEDLSDNTKMEKINDTLWDVCGREPWYFLEAFTTSVTIDGTGKVTVPTSISKITSFVETATGRTLEPIEHDDLVKLFPNRLTETGTPIYYYYSGVSFYVWPIPDTTYTWFLKYMRIHPELTISSVEGDLYLPARHHRVVLLGALSKLYVQDDDPELGAAYDELFEIRYANMREDLWRWNHDKDDVMLDVDPEPYWTV